MTRLGKVWLVTALAGVATAPVLAQEPAAFHGVSALQPTGSPGIGADALVAAYDMTSLTEDGLLRDFGPHGLHGLFETSDGGRFCPPGRCLREVTGPGPVSGARFFRAVGDRVDLPEDAAFALDGPMTVAAWVRVDSVGVHQHIAACDDKWAFWVTPADQYRLGIRGAGWSSAPGSVEAGAWAAVVVVLRGTKGDPLEPSTVSIHVNGRRAESGPLARTDEARAAGIWNPGELFSDDACYIGFESHQGLESHETLPFFGAVDELLIFGRAWTEEEIRAFSVVSG